MGAGVERNLDCLLVFTKRYFRFIHIYTFLSMYTQTTQYLHCRVFEAFRVSYETVQSPKIYTQWNIHFILLIRNMRPVSVLNLLNLLRTFLPLACVRNRGKIKMKIINGSDGLCASQRVKWFEWNKMGGFVLSVLLLELTRRQRAVIWSLRRRCRSTSLIDLICFLFYVENSLVKSFS